MHTGERSATGDDSSSDADASHSGPLIRIVHFEEQHLADIVRKDWTGTYKRLWENGDLDHIKDCPFAYTALNRKGEAVAMAGLTEYWKGRAEGWAFLVNDTKAEFLAVHRAVKRFLQLYVGRLEVTVAAEFTEGHRWAKMLGFKLNSRRMKQYFPGGGDAYMYARINDPGRYQWHQ